MRRSVLITASASLVLFAMGCQPPPKPTAKAVKVQGCDVGMVPADQPVGDESYLFAQPGGGWISPERVQETLTQKRNAFQRCYDHLTNLCPQVHQGKMLLRFVVDPVGSVAEAHIAHSTFRSVSMAHCVIAVLKQAVFPQPQRGNIAIIEYPLSFFMADAHLYPRGEVTLVESEQDYGLNPEQVKATFNKALTRMKRCYQQTLLKKTLLSGRVIANLVVEPSGTVSEVKLFWPPSLADTKLYDCIYDTLRALVFPKPGSLAAVVSATLKFDRME